MALPVLPNPSNFLAVALVINRSREGPRFVFHYPPHVLPARGGRGKSDDEDVEDEDDIWLERAAQLSDLEAAGPSMPSPAELLQWNQDDHLITESGSQIVPWEHVAGFPTQDLGRILTPARAYHKRQFQLSLDQLYCVSYPIYVPENGVWKRKAKKERKSKASGMDDEGIGAAETDGGAQTGGDTRATESDQVEVKDAAKPSASNNEEAADKKSSMTMFNLVFILRPKKHEVKDLVDVMFVHIIKKVNKALKYCQQRSDFVWKESKRILALKDKGREDKRKMSSLWDEILATSSLAASMQDIYDAVSQNKIAALQLDTAEGTVTHSVQIPIPFYISDLPQDGDLDAQGLWITTANTFVGDDALDGLGYLDKNFALLLMDDEKRIISELQTDPDGTTLSMIEFVRHCRATLSLYQVAQQASNILSPDQVRKYAQHFIFWRRAIAIPPLHARDIYVLSPNCRLSRLPQAAAQWARQFPLAPPLPNFLAELSVAPRPYKTHCPAKPHRPLYMAMLAWLMRGGWVTQLCTFAYVVVWPEIIYEVEHALEAQTIAKAKRAQAQGGEPASFDSTITTSSSSTGDGEGQLNTPTYDDGSAERGLGAAPLALSASSLDESTATLRELSLASSSQTEVGDDGDDDDDSSSRSEGSSVSPSSPAQPKDKQDDGQRKRRHRRRTRSRPTTAEQVAEKARLERIADKAARDLADKATAHARKTPPCATAHPSVNDAPHLAGISPHIILDAKKATGRESLYLDAIARRLSGKGGVGVGIGEEGRKSSGGGDQSRGDGGDASRAEATTSADNASKDATADVGNRIPSTAGVPGITIRPAAKDGVKDGKDLDERVAAAWPRFWKYFNGRSALERVALQEDMKRKEVWTLLTAMSEYLLTVRHW